MKLRLFSCLLTFSAASLLLSGCGKSDKESETVAAPTPSEPPAVLLQRLGYSISAADLITAAGNGDAEAVRLLLVAGIDPNSQDADGSTPLIRAAESGHVAAVKVLLENGADANRPGRESWTALMSAAYYNRPEVLSLLLEKGANPSLKDVNNWSALMKAVHQGNVEAVKVIAPHSKQEIDRALMLASLTGRSKVVGALIDSGANPNAQIEKKQTALMFAAMKGQVEAVKVLLERGADPLAINEDGSTASILALSNGHVEVSKLIDDSIAERPAVDPLAASPVAASTPTPAPVPTPEPAPTPAPEAVVPDSDAAALTSATPLPIDSATTPISTELPASSPSSSPAPMIDPDAPATESIAATPEEGEYVAWAAKYQINAQDPASANADPDADGFSNREEFEGGTDPKDPDVHPSRVGRLRMLAFKGEEVPLVLQSLSGGKATLRHVDSGETVVVTVGSKVSGAPFKVTGIREKSTTDKNGLTVDISEVAMVNVETGSKVVLLPDLPARSPESHAVLQFEGLGEKITVRQDQEFSIPGDASTKLRVMDLRPTEVIVRVMPSGEVVTIPLQGAR